MGSKFISTSDGDLGAVSDGTLDILGASLGSQNLTPGFTIKIDSERKLFSTALDISDVINLQSELDATIQTPYTGTIEATDFQTPSVPSHNTAITDLNNKTQNINTSGVVTNITGKFEFNSIPVLQITSTRDFSTSGNITGTQITCSDLTTSTYPSLNTTLDEINTSFGVIKTEVTNNQLATAANTDSITVLSSKTQNQSASSGITQFGGDLSIGNLFINGNGVNNGFIEGDIDINGSANFAQDLILKPNSLISFQGNASGTIATDNNKLSGLYTTAINGLTATGGKYSQTSNDIYIVNTADVRTLIGSGVGDLVWLANSIRAGDTYHLKMSGLIETDGKNEELKIEIKLGFNLIHTTNYIELEDVPAEYAWELELDFTFRTDAGQLRSNSQFTYNKGAGSNDFRGWSSNTTTGVNTSTNASLTATATWLNA
jgi:hypothetical protein